MEPHRYFVDDIRGKGCVEHDWPIQQLVCCFLEVLWRCRVETDHDPTAHAEILCIRTAAAQVAAWRLNVRACSSYSIFFDILFSVLSEFIIGANRGDGGNAEPPGSQPDE